MRIFYAFLIILVTVILWMLPVTQAIYDFRTDLRTDTFSTDTAVAVTTANETLLTDLYNCDMGSIDIDSDLATDLPLPSSINCTNRVLLVSGLTANTSRILDITYAFNAITDHPSLGTLLGWFPFIWWLILVAFPMAAIFAIFTGKD